MDEDTRSAAAPEHGDATPTPAQELLGATRDTFWLGPAMYRVNSLKLAAACVGAMVVYMFGFRQANQSVAELAPKGVRRVCVGGESGVRPARASSATEHLHPPLSPAAPNKACPG